MPTLQSVTTALEVFEIVALHQPIGVSDLARRIGIGKSTVQRCLVTLQAAGWLRPEPGLQTRWVITSKTFTLGRHVADTGHLRTSVLPVMEQLRDATRETIHLVVADGREAVLLERLESPQAIRIFLPLGTHGPLHASATGKAILSRYSEAPIADYLAHELKAFTSKTINEADSLRAELQAARRRGYAMAIDEREIGASAIAAPIVDGSGKPVAALSISCPTSRFSKAVRARYADLIVAAAGRAGAQLG